MPSRKQAICLHDMRAPCVAVTGPGEIPGLWHFAAQFHFPAPIQKPFDPDIVGSPRTRFEAHHT